MAGVALLMEMGCGKTLTSIAVIGRGFLNNKIRKVLVVCPNSVMTVWHNELKEFAEFEYKDMVLEGDLLAREKKLGQLCKEEGLKIAIINYEASWRLLEPLIKYNPDLVICDESQRIKNRTAKQSKAMHKLGEVAKYKMILSGTPIQNSPIDLFSQYKFLDNGVYGKTYFPFENRYVIKGGYGGHQIIKYINQDELIKKAHSLAYRVTKQEALDLPKQIFINRYCDLEDTARRIYDSMEKECLIEIESEVITAQNILTKMLRLSQITGGFLPDIRELISKAKLNTLKELVEDIVLDNNKKLIVFARFLNEVSVIEKLMCDMKIQYVTYAGSTSIKDRNDYIYKFQNDDNVKVFIAQIQTAGTGITLTASDTVIYYSMNYNYSDFEQSQSRNHRIGQTKECTYITLLCKDTIDTKIMSALRNKEKIATSIVDNWRYYFKKGDSENE